MFGQQALGLDLRSTASGLLASGRIISLIPRPGVQSSPITRGFKWTLYLKYNYVTAHDKKT